ncbi:MAG: hypothetical protein VKK80_14935 [Prochlorothrix sp.]|nr:hypothetical protein [Prochlorothrix sp.]
MGWWVVAAIKAAMTGGGDRRDRGRGRSPRSRQQLLQLAQQFAVG